MARPLQDGSRAEPTAALPGGPGSALGGTLAPPPPVCRAPLALNCALCPAGPRTGPRRRRHALYRCMRGPEPPRSRSSQAPESPVAGQESSARPEPPAAEQGVPHPAAAPLPRSTRPSLEQVLGARLRHMGDRFHRERPRQPPPEQQQQLWPVWDHFYHFLFQLLGVFYNLPTEGHLGLGPN